MILNVLGASLYTKINDNMTYNTTNNTPKIDSISEVTMIPDIQYVTI